MMAAMTSFTGPWGLDSDEARRRQSSYGRNDIGDREQHGVWHTLRSVASEPMFLLLIVAAAIYLVIGDLADGLLLAFFAVMTVSLVVLQERRSEHALDALRELAVPMARVIRDGRIQRLAAGELVPGDAVVVGEGERIPADAIAREASALVVDESLLTGESVPVRKTATVDAVDIEQAAPGGDDLPFVYAGTLVVGGHGIAEVATIGKQTRVGRIGASLASIDVAATPLEQHLRRLVRAFSTAALLTSMLLVLWYGLQRGQWLQGALSGIALGMAMLPEEFPMALVVFLALGAWRLAKRKVLTRRPAVIEALGAVTVLCVDKTGTLTHNRIRLRCLVTEDSEVDLAHDATLPAQARTLLEHAALASRRGGVDPLDNAVLVVADQALLGSAQLHPQWQLAHEYPLTPALLAMSHVWLAEDGERHLAAKGAPEAIAALCHLDAARTEAWLQRVRTLADQGLRVLAVARGTAADDGQAKLPASQHDHDFTWLGLLAFEDPLRAAVADAVASAHSAGIAVAMVTGDHAATALAIAREAGIDTAPGVLSGEQLERLDDAALAAAVRSARVYARVMPEQKLRLVQAFKANGHTVAMTGDGVNDAPALKAAHVGIAMGVRGTDVAREAAGLVLLDEDFSRIVAGVRMGRHIFDNLRKVMTYITAIHVPIVGLALLPLLFGLPPLLLPAHVVLTEMVIDPVCSLAFERAPEDPRVMQRPPRSPQEGIVGLAMLWQGLLQGGALLAATLSIYMVGLRIGVEPAAARTLAIVALTAGNLMLVLINAGTGGAWRALFGVGFGAFWWVAGVASGVLALALVWPAARELLHFGLPPWHLLAIALAWVIAVVALAAVASRLLARRTAVAAAMT
jgi:Ca2+-transporting ATPase